MPQATYPPVPDTVKVELLADYNDSLGTVDVENIVYVRDTVIVRNSAYYLTVANDAADGWLAQLAGQYPNNMTLRQVRVTDLDTVTHPSVTVFPGHVGTRAGAVLVGAACAVIQLLGDPGGTPQRSYLRHGPLMEVDTDSNKLENAVMTSLDSAWTSFLLTDLIASVPTGAAVIVSVFEPGASGSPTPYRTTGMTNTLDAITVRQRVGRSVSRNE